MQHDALSLAAETYLLEEVAPRAEAIDRDFEAVREAYQGLASLGLLALRRPLRYGGPEWDDQRFRWFQEEVARSSGALAFLQTQHQSAVGLIARGTNEGLKERVLPGAHDGTFGCGIAFSQLRRPGPPMLRAEPTSDGYLFEGSAPWATGAGIYQHLLAAAELPDGRAVFAVVPFGSNGEGRGLIEQGPTMQVAVMQSANTVEVFFRDWHVAEEDVVEIKPPKWVHRNDQIQIAVQGFFAVGCARAGLDLVLGRYEKTGDRSILAAWEALDREVGECRDALEAAQVRSGEETTDEKLRLRAWVIDLAVRCAHAAIAATGGSANAADHPAQRVYREALVYTVSAQTEAIRQATLERLSAPRSNP